LHGEKGNIGEYSHNLAFSELTFPILINYSASKCLFYPLMNSGDCSDKFLQAVYAFKWALENFAKDEDKVILYHVNQSVPPVMSAGTGMYLHLGCALFRY
jgi:hypothetical protein